MQVSGFVGYMMRDWNSIFAWLPNLTTETGGDKTRPFGIDMSIESMSSQEFSMGIFYFLVVAIIIFLGIILLFMLKDKANKLKTGEKWLFAWLFMGIVVAVAFGTAQMVNGYLF